MGRPKLQEKDKKTKLGITISKDINQLLEQTTNNKSKFIEDVLSDHFKGKKK